MGSKQNNDSNIIVAGEASESDDDDVSVDNSVNKSIGGEQAIQSGVIVSGEASESDDEYEVNTSTELQKGLPPLTVETSQEGDTTSVPSTPISPEPHQVKSKYNSLLHRKLKERNMSLRRHIVDSVHQSYTIAAKDLHNLAVQLQKSHIAIQDVSYHMRETTNSLFKLEDKIDIVVGCSILPEINIPSQSVQATAQN